jgi:Spy/CpxP family protein refolding chaperone
MFRTPLGCTLLLLAGSADAASPSPYVGQESRAVKVLSPQETSDCLSGEGMGLAKAAELNGYLGPVHVLELATQLDLTAEQKTKTEALFQEMQARAIALGQELIEEERALDRLFASHAVTSERLGDSLARIGRLQGHVRHAHLEAHIKQTALLTPAQVAKYNRLRGYEVTGGQEPHEQRQHWPPHPAISRARGRHDPAWRAALRAGGHLAGARLQLAGGVAGRLLELPGHVLRTRRFDVPQSRGVDGSRGGRFVCALRPDGGHVPADALGVQT